MIRKPQRRAAPRRNTQQRSTIRQVLEEADRPLGPQEILEAAQEIAPRLGLATVYRNIRTMVEAGDLRTVELPGSPSRYEIAGKEHHHHFHCRLCDRVYEVDDCPGKISTLTPPGFQLEAHEIYLYGLCDDCIGT